MQCVLSRVHVIPCVMCDVCYFDMSEHVKYMGSLIICYNEITGFGVMIIINTGEITKH